MADADALLEPQEVAFSKNHGAALVGFAFNPTLWRTPPLPSTAPPALRTFARVKPDDDRTSEVLVGRFRIERELGRGGMAAVFLAEDLQHHRPVAVKILHDELAQSVGIDRFRREIAILARLTHPNILPLHDSASGASGERLFFVMPFVDGETLRRRLDRGPLPVREAVRIAVDVARALDYAHRQGVIHRDVKPENILFVDAQPVVTDFGIAHAVREADGERLTLSGIVLGTPAYMSPEQMSGERQIDGRSDIFSLGSVLYEMIAGLPPFAAPTVSATLTRIATASTPKLSDRRDDVTPELETAIARSLAKDPAERFASAAELASALEQSIASTHATPISNTSYRSARAVWRWAGAGVTLASLALAILAMRAKRADTAEVPSLAVLPFVTESADTADAYIGSGIADELLTALADVPGVRVASRTSSFRRDASDDVRSLGKRLGVASILEGSVRRSGAMLRVTARLVDASRDAELWAASFDRPSAQVFQTQEEIARAIVGHLRVRFANAGNIVRRRTSNPEAHDLVLRARRLGPFPDTVAHALELLDSAAKLDSTYAETWAELARRNQAMAIFHDQARASSRATLSSGELLRRARDAAQRAVELDSASSSARLALANVVFRYDWDWARAEREFKHAIALNPSRESYASYHRFLRSMGRFDDARTMLDSANAHDVNPARVGSRQGLNYGRISYFAHDFDRALRETLADTASRQRDRTWPVWTAQIYLGVGRYAQAESLLSLDIANADAGRSSSLAILYARTGRQAKAREVLAHLTPDQDLPTQVASARVELGDTVAAIAELHRAIDSHDPLVVDLKVDPMLNPLRSTSAFRALIAPLKFP